jgi:hypothetical protein
MRIFPSQMAGYSMQDQSMSFMDSDMPNMIGAPRTSVSSWLLQS